MMKLGCKVVKKCSDTFSHFDSCKEMDRQNYDSLFHPLEHSCVVKLRKAGVVDLAVCNWSVLHSLFKAFIKISSQL